MTILEFLMDVKRIPYWDRTPAISDMLLEDLINQVDMSKKDRLYEPYPILGCEPQQYIPRGLLMVHEGQALKNHGQSLDTLAQRGGLGWAEALTIIEGKSWRDAEHNENTAEVVVRKMIAEYMKDKESSNVADLIQFKDFENWTMYESRYYKGYQDALKLSLEHEETPLSLEEFKSLNNGEWVYVEEKDSGFDSCWECYPHGMTNLDTYGTHWLVYRMKG